MKEVVNIALAYLIHNRMDLRLLKGTKREKSQSMPDGDTASSSDSTSEYDSDNESNLELDARRNIQPSMLSAPQQSHYSSTHENLSPTKDLESSSASESVTPPNERTSQRT